MTLRVYSVAVRPVPEQAKGVRPMVTNEQIRRARPSVDSPLGRLIRGEITVKEYEQQVKAKKGREGVAASDHK